MHGKLKLNLGNENYRHEKYLTQTAWMKRTNKNYTTKNYIKWKYTNKKQWKLWKSYKDKKKTNKGEKSIRMKKSIGIKIIRIKVYEWKLHEWIVHD